MRDPRGDISTLVGPAESLPLGRDVRPRRPAESVFHHFERRDDLAGAPRGRRRRGGGGDSRGGGTLSKMDKMRKEKENFFFFKIKKFKI